MSMRFNLEQHNVYQCLGNAERPLDWTRKSHLRISTIGEHRMDWMETRAKRFTDQGSTMTVTPLDVGADRLLPAPIRRPHKAIESASLIPLHPPAPSIQSSQPVCYLDFHQPFELLFQRRPLDTALLSPADPPVSMTAPTVASDPRSRRSTANQPRLFPSLLTRPLRAMSRIPFISTQHQHCSRRTTLGTYGPLSAIEGELPDLSRILRRREAELHTRVHTAGAVAASQCEPLLFSFKMLTLPLS